MVVVESGPNDVIRGLSKGSKIERGRCQITVVPSVFLGKFTFIPGQ